MLSERSKRIPSEAIRGKEIVFQPISWHAQDVAVEDSDDPNDEKYMIKMFGMDQQNRTISVTVTEFTPFFYVRVPDHWDERHASQFHRYLIENPSRRFAQAILPIKILPKKDFWGFTNFKEFKFARLCFTSHKAMRNVMYALQKPITINTLGLQRHTFKQYESNIEPFLRFIHLADIMPTGWVRLAPGTFRSTEILQTSCQIDIEVNWRKVKPFQSEDTARFLIASFDLECASDTGDFPVPINKKYRKVAADLYEAYNDVIVKKYAENTHIEAVHACLLKPFGLELSPSVTERYALALDRMCKVFPKNESYDKQCVARAIKVLALDDITTLLAGRMLKKQKREEIIDAINIILCKPSLSLPEVRGDAIIQIGTTFHHYGDRECIERVIITNGTCKAIDNVRVVQCKTEEELLLEWRKLMQETNPDVMTGYNIFGFDFWYLYERATDLGLKNEFMRLGRFMDIPSKYEVKMLSSSALGDNELKFIDMHGRVNIDMMKVIQRDHKLDSYKLDAVASHFMKMNKNDVSPQDIFRLQKGSDEDRKVIAEYCIQDCALCNHLIMKLEILANNMGMSNVCLVPLSYIFMRGQGIKIFSLVLKQCKDENFVIPVVRPARANSPEEEAEQAEEAGYEGAIVLEPKEGIYIDQPISVLDYASLYPSSMISENLSHDCIVLDPAYDNLPGVEYLPISYDIYEGVGDKKKKVGERVCKYVQLPNEEKGVIPRILQKLLKARKTTRKKAEWQLVRTKDGNTHTGYADLDKDTNTYTVKLTAGECDGQTITLPATDVDAVEDAYNEFQKAVLDGLQLAYKVTANSLYGQIGARTSPIHLKDIAACTTATGRKMIMSAKDFIEKNYEGAEIIYGDSVTSYTPITMQLVSTGEVIIDTIENIASRFGGLWLPCREEGKQDKEACNISGVNVWSDNGWTPILRVIRHQLASHKKIVRVLTHTGIVDVTDDHSLLRRDGSAVSANDIKIGDEIMHHNATYGSDIMERVCDISEEEAEIMGFFMGDGSCGSYALQHGMKYTWALNNASLRVHDHYKGLCEKVYPHFKFNVMNTIKSSGVYKLSPSAGAYGDIKRLVEKYKSVLYNGRSKVVPIAILNSPESIRKAFLKGFYDADGDKDVHGYMRFDQKSQLSCATLYTLAHSLGYRVSINDRASKLDTLRLTLTKDEQRKPFAIKRMRNIPYSGYVYDLTTENHHFQSGVGSIIVHNTDSIFISFKTQDQMGNVLTGIDAIRKSRELGMDVSKNFKKLIKAPHDLEWEKLFDPFILLSKKRYVGNKYEHDDHKFKQNSMGIVLKRRDNAQIVKKIYGGAIDKILNDKNIHKSIEFVREELEKLVNGETPMEELIISKSLKANYADPTRIAHKVLAERIGDRDPGNRPQVNDRIPYVYVEQPPPDPTIPKSKQPKILQGERIEHPSYIREQNLRPDYGFYITNQIMKPLLQLYAIVADQLGIRTKEEYDALYNSFLAESGNEGKAKAKIDNVREKDIQAYLFDPFLNRILPPKPVRVPATKATKATKSKLEPIDPALLASMASTVVSTSRDPASTSASASTSTTTTEQKLDASNAQDAPPEKKKRAPRQKKPLAGLEEAKNPFDVPTTTVAPSTIDLSAPPLTCNSVALPPDPFQELAKLKPKRAVRSKKPTEPTEPPATTSSTQQGASAPAPEKPAATRRRPTIKKPITTPPVEEAPTPTIDTSTAESIPAPVPAKKRTIKKVQDVQE